VNSLNLLKDITYFNHNNKVMLYQYKREPLSDDEVNRFTNVFNL
jgi:hypothetical protein